MYNFLLHDLLPPKDVAIGARIHFYAYAVKIIETPSSREYVVHLTQKVQVEVAECSQQSVSFVVAGMEFHGLLDATALHFLTKAEVEGIGTVFQTAA